MAEAEARSRSAIVLSSLTWNEQQAENCQDFSCLGEFGGKKPLFFSKLSENSKMFFEVEQSKDEA